jgi:hypothetical protein
MRRLYKLLSWDYETNEGQATDGTSWEGSPIIFAVPGTDLAAEYNGFLNIGEVFSAEESPNHVLFDVIIERGERAPVQPAGYTAPGLSSDAVENIVEGSRNTKEQIRSALPEYNTLPPTKFVDSFTRGTRDDPTTWEDDLPVEIEINLARIRALAGDTKMLSGQIKCLEMRVTMLEQARNARIDDGR